MMRTFDEAVELLRQPKEKVDDLGDRHFGFMQDIYQNEWIAGLSGSLIRRRIGPLSEEQLKGAITLCVDMLFTGLVLGMAMKGDGLEGYDA